jgi:4-amino-4-deoxy-L-arabinose transferase-like glycosyltransferase
MLEAGHLQAIKRVDQGLDPDSAPPLSGSLKPAVASAILAAALLFNAAMVLAVLPHSASADYNLSSGDLYDLIANNVAQGHGYRLDPSMGPTMLREPGYPLLLAGMFKIVGQGEQGPRVLCIILAFAASLILLRLVREVTGDRLTALVTALLFLVYPGILMAEARSGVEMASVFTCLLFMLALHRALGRGALSMYGVAGALLGLATLVRSEVVVFPLFVLLYLLVSSQGWGERLKVVLRMAVLGASTIVVMSPWIIRNYLLVHTLVPTSSISGTSSQEGLYTCKHLSQYGTFYLTQQAAGRERAQVAGQLGVPFEGAYYYQFFYSPQDELTFNRALLDRVGKEYRSNPSVLADCAAQNLVKFWFLGKTPRATQMNVLLQLPLLGLAAGGIVVLWKRKRLRDATTALLYILYIPLVHAPIIAHARHSMLVVPYVLLFAAVFVVSMWTAFRTSDSPRQPLNIAPREQ